jgi:hypothetical protein
MSLYLTLPGGASFDNPEGFAFSSETKIGEIVTAFIPILMSLVGIILFLMLIAGGFTMLTAVGNPDKVKKGQVLITNAIIGFVIIFVAFWIMQILQIAFGLDLGFNTITP